MRRSLCCRLMVMGTVVSCDIEGLRVCRVGERWGRRAIEKINGSITGPITYGRKNEYITLAQLSCVPFLCLVPVVCGLPLKGGGRRAGGSLHIRLSASTRTSGGRKRRTSRTHIQSGRNKRPPRTFVPCTYLG